MISALNRWASERETSIELLIADDFDAWEQFKTEIPQERPNHLDVKVLKPKKKVGQMKAMHEAFKISTGKYVLLADPDQSHCVAGMQQLFDTLSSGALIAHGARPARPELGPVRRLGSSFANVLCRKLLGINVPDINSPFFAAKGECRELISQMPPGISNARLFLLARYPCRVTVVGLPLSRNSSNSHYRLPDLVRVLLCQISQCLKIRQSLRQLLHD